MSFLFCSGSCSMAHSAHCLSCFDGLIHRRRRLSNQFSTLPSLGGNSRLSNLRFSSCTTFFAIPCATCSISLDEIGASACLPARRFITVSANSSGSHRLLRSAYSTNLECNRLYLRAALPRSLSSKRSNDSNRTGFISHLFGLRGMREDELRHYRHSPRKTKAPQ